MGKFDFNFDFYDKLSEEIKVTDKNKSVSRVIIVAFLLCALVLSPIKNDINRGHFNQKAKRTGLITAGNKSIDLHQVAFYKDRKYDVDTLLTLVNAEFDTWINPAFIEYQKTLNSNQFNKLIEEVKKLNEDIRKDESLGAGFCIGHSYFCGLKPETCTPGRLQQIVKYDLIPTLEEYWFDDKGKVNAWKQKLQDALK